MIKVLKVLLKKNKYSPKANEFHAELLESGSMDVENIVDELLNDGVDINRELALEIIEHFTRKSTELIMSGYQIKTGLVNICPTIQGSIHDKKWNPSFNSVKVLLTEGRELSSALTTSNFEIQNEEGISLEIMSKEQQEDIKYNRNYASKSDNKDGDNLACGIAFRTWLFKS